MLKKFRLVYVITFLLFLQVPAPLFAQAKKALLKKTIAAKKPVAKTIVTAKPGPVRIRMITDSGIIIIKLSDSTPLHRDNFIKLVKEKFYDSLLFHRVIPLFMIQGGDPGSKNAAAGTLLGNGGAGIARIPAEFKPSLYHKKGALAAARDGNPEKASSASQFYLVEGKLFTDEQLNMLEQQRGSIYTAAQREMYKTIGGAAQLDQGYTVFGEVETGQEVIGKIATVQRDGNNRPLGNIRMKMELIKQGF